MQTDNQATALLIRMMPLMWRELQIRLDPQRFFTDPHYAETIIRLATDAAGASERLRAIGERLRHCLGQMTAGPAGAARSAPAQAAPQTAPQTAHQTAPQTAHHAAAQAPRGVAGGAAAPAPPSSAPTLEAPPTAWPAGDANARPDTANEQPPAGRYLRSLR